MLILWLFPQVFTHMHPWSILFLSFQLATFFALLLPAHCFADLWQNAQWLMRYQKQSAKPNSPLGIWGLPTQLPCCSHVGQCAGWWSQHAMATLGQGAFSITHRRLYARLHTKVMRAIRPTNSHDAAVRVALKIEERSWTEIYLRDYLY